MHKQKRRLKILIADDNELVRGTLSVVLSGREYILEEASNGKEALEKIEENKPDIILLDCIMPVMDGFETYRRLKQNPETRNIPIIFCTSTSIAEAKERKFKADDYIEKPFSVEELLAKINKILHQKAI